jgi:hypothetical protein
MQIARGEESAVGNPRLKISISLGDSLLTPAALEFSIFDTSTAALRAEPLQIFPNNGYQQVDLDDDEITTGVFAIAWTAPDDAAIGTHRLRVRATFSVGAEPVEWDVSFEVVDVAVAAPVQTYGYTTIERVRAEGITEAMASDGRLSELIEEASIEIDKICRWWFQARAKSVTLDGNGRTRLDLPAPPIEIYEVVIEGVRLDPGSWHLVGICPRGPSDPRKPLAAIERKAGSATRFYDLGVPRLVWPKGQGNIVIRGVFGYTEDNGTAFGRVPLAIVRACNLMVIRMQWPQSFEEAIDARNAGRTKRMKTHEQEIEYFPSGGGAAGGNAPATAFDSDPEISRILAAYIRPLDLGFG